MIDDDSTEPNKSLSHTSRDADEEFSEQAAAIDAMFLDAGLKHLRVRHPTHPAIALRDAVSTITQQHDLPIEQLITLMTRVSTVAFDRDVWLSLPAEGDLWEFIPDQEAADRVRANIRNPQRFNETLAEVRTWAHLRSKNLSARLLEEDGRPDILLEGDKPTWVEVKFLHESTTAAAIQSRVKKANKQLRTASEQGSGVMYLYLDREPTPEPYTPDSLESIPENLAEKVAEAERLMKGPYFRSIGALALVWHRTLFGPLAQTTPLIMQRVCRVLEHPNAYQYSGPDLDVLSVSRWTYTMIGVGVDRPSPPGGGKFSRVRQTEPPSNGTSP